MNNGWHVKTTEKSANDLFMEFVRSALKSKRTVSCGCWGLFVCFTWNHKAKQDTGVEIRPTHRNMTQKTVDQYQALMTTFMQISLDHIGSQRGGQIGGSSTGDLLKPQGHLTCQNDLRCLCMTLNNAAELRFHDLKYSSCISLCSERWLMVYLYEFFSETCGPLFDTR